MSSQEEYTFWRLTYYLISNQEYRMIQLSKDQKEIWLEKKENKKAQIIRLLRYDLDWSNWMQRDIELTASNGERIRKRLVRGEMNVINIYVSAFPPVDDYEFRLRQSFSHSSSIKTKVFSYILDREHLQLNLNKLGSLFNDTITIDTEDVLLDEDVERIKQQTLTYAVNRIKQEKSLFEYGKPFFTYIFIAIQVVMFFLMEISGGSTNSSTLIRFGAKFNPLILEGEWWRFFTPIILHIGVFHLLMNSLALYYIGSAVERIYGNIRFLIIYLLAGFSGALASFLFSASLSAGASGAIFGCFGALLYFGVIHPRLFFRTMGMNIIVVLLINLVFGFSISSVDNAGHIGGLIGGFLATGIVHLPNKKKWHVQMLFLIATGLLFSCLLKYGYEHESALIDEQSVLGMSQEHIKAEEYEKARTLLTNFIAENDASAQAYFLLSYAEIKEGKIEEARGHLQKAIALNSDFHEAYYNLALVYLDKQDIIKAKENAGMAVKLRPDQKQYTDLLKKIEDLE